MERHAANPLIAPELLKNRNFVLATAAGLLIMIAMMGVVIYLPTYFQIVNELNAAAAGYLMVPHMIGMMITSTAMGFIASKTGKYKWMPTTSCAVTAVALFAFSMISTETSLLVLGVLLFAMGFGLGLGQQILVLVIQNEFDISIVGTATASNNFFREIGATIGSGLVGSIFAANLAQELQMRMVPIGGVQQLGTDINSLTPEIVRELPQELAALVQISYNEALTPVFFMIVPLLLISLVAVCFLKETPLAETIEKSGHMNEEPDDTSSVKAGQHKQAACFD